MKYIPPTKAIGIEVARNFKKILRENNIPIIDVLLFGSLASDNIHKWSDIDIAVIHKPFADAKMQERRTIRRLHKDSRFPVDILCFYPEDMENKLLGIAQEVKKHGIAV